MAKPNPFGRSRRRKQWQRAENRRLEQRERAMEELPFWPGVPQWEQDQIETQNQNDQIQCHICYLSPEETNAQFFYNTFCECAGNVGTVCEDCILIVVRTTPDQCMTCHRPWKNVRITRLRPTLDHFHERYRRIIFGLTAILTIFVICGIISLTFGPFVEAIGDFVVAQLTWAKDSPHLYAVDSVLLGLIVIVFAIFYLIGILLFFSILLVRFNPVIARISYYIYQPFWRNSWGAVADLQITAQN